VSVIILDDALIYSETNLSSNSSRLALRRIHEIKPEPDCVLQNWSSNQLFFRSTDGDSANFAYSRHLPLVLKGGFGTFRWSF